MFSLVLIGCASAFLLPPEHGFQLSENITISSVTLSADVLALYGLKGYYGPQPIERPVREDLDQALKQNKEILQGMSENATLGDFFLEVWKQTDNPTVRWWNAHVLNFLGGLDEVVVSTMKVIIDAQAILMGECKCPNNPRLASEFSRICAARKLCQVTDEEGYRAILAIKNLSNTYRYFKNFLENLVHNTLPVKEFLDQNLKVQLMAAKKISTKFKEICKIYEYFVAREAAYRVGLSVEQLLDQMIMLDSSFRMEVVVVKESETSRKNNNIMNKLI